MFELTFQENGNGTCIEVKITLYYIKTTYHLGTVGSRLSE